MEKKDSIFSSLAPVTPAASLPASRPAVSDQEVFALKQKIEAMEKNIVSQLEKRLSETRSVPPPPPPPSMSSQSLLTKIAELDKKLEAFTSTAMLSSAQMKNVEESKISTRREIEDLLKVVREQQKYSEMDRQMHDQLEKSWRRVEDLEKKLMDFYSSTLNRSSEAGRNAPPPLLAGEVEKIVEARLQKFLSDMDLRFRAVTEKLDGQTPALVQKNAERVSDMVTDLDIRLAAFVTESRKLHHNISSSEDSIKEIYLNIKREMMSALKEAVRDENAEITKRVLEIEAIFKKNAAETADLIKAENAKNSDKIIEFSRLSAYTLSGAVSLSSGLDTLAGRLGDLRDGIRTFVDGFKAVKLEALLGVSGALARKNFEGLQVSLKEVESELALFEARKNEINCNLKAIAGTTKVKEQGSGNKD